MVEGNIGYGATGRAVAGLRGVKELTHACTSNTGTGEGSALSLRVATPGPQRKGRSRNPLTHEVEQSDPAIVVERRAYWIGDRRTRLAAPLRCSCVTIWA